jgi:hypothetical protein
MSSWLEHHMVTEPEAKPNLARDADTQTRERSTIEFPYMDLDDAIAVAKAVHDTSGSGVCQHDQLAAKLETTTSSSGFRVRISTARTFGLIETDRSGSGVRLTALGKMIVDNGRAREAKAKAFLAVPLYSKIYELNRGKVLAPPAALEREMADLGVAQKQTGRARQAFERSAQAAGFFESGRDRLVAPGIAEEPPKKEEPKKGGSGGGGDGDIPLHLHTMIRGLLEKLPPPDSKWPITEQAKWLRTAAHMFGLIYASEGNIKIEAEDPPD